MRRRHQLFDSRVARRIFTLFLLASLVPLSVLALILLRQVGSALEAQAYDQLASTARSYGQVALDRLLSTTTLLERPEVLTGSTSTASRLGLDAVVLVRDDAQVKLLGDGTWSPPLATFAAVPEMPPTLAVVPGENGLDVVIAARVSGGVLLARLDPAYLPHIDDALGRGMEVCIFGSDSLTTPIHCSAPLSASATAELHRTRQHQSSGQFTWTGDGEEWLASHWQLFLPSRFLAEPWVIVISQPRSTALASLAIFNRVVPQTILVTLALIVILAIAQIRRTLHPLNELLAGTKRIAAQDFATPVAVANTDEFGTLAAALNGMAEQLDQQFGALRALADIDRSILQTTAIEPVLHTLFERLDALVPGGHCAALIVDTDNTNNGRFYRHDQRGSAPLERIVVTATLREWLSTCPPDLLADEHTLRSLGLPFAGDGSVHVTAMMTGDTVAGALVTAAGDGKPLDAHVQASIRELAARVAVAIAADKREAELIRRAHFDSLTLLPNRELLEDRMQQAVAHAQREDRALAVLFIDLDGFKGVNDTLGHRSGDEVLKETALRLSAVVREADTVARLGGDEYAIVLPQVQSPLEAESVALEAIEALRRPFVVEGREIYVSASIGLAVFPEDGVTAGELLRKADMAMYNAKQAGKSCARFFAEEMDRRLQERHSLHHDLHNAFDTEEFTLAYQPQIDIRSGRLVATEALLRWVHPRRGTVSPALFVPILEETGLIHEVGAWVLQKALADFVGWRRAGLALERVAVNVSARQLFDRRFVENVARALEDVGLEGHHLEVELTEASLVQDFRAANDALTRLRSNGVRIALDDFGTGYSSLAYLNELVFDTLKIDRAFVVNLPADKAVAIVKAIVAVATSLQKEVVAEGIESQLQLHQLRHLGCQFGQGYLLGKPLSAADLPTWHETSHLGGALAAPTVAPRVA